MASRKLGLPRQLQSGVLCAVLVLLCAACRVDVDINVTVARDGSGVIEIAAEADQEIMQQAPNLANELRFDDAIAAGWVVSVPTSTATGGLQVLLSHTFQDPAQATALLASLNGPDGPLRGITLTRSRTSSVTTFQLDGTLGLTGDLTAFSDADLVGVLGAAPYADEMARRQLQPADVVRITFHTKLPGQIESTTGDRADEQLTWLVPLTGPAVAVSTVTTAAESTNSWARPVSLAALTLLVAWLFAATFFILYVVLARRRRELARSRRANGR